MKKLTLTLCAVAAVSSAALAGETYSGKEMKQVQAPCPSWYADNEWNIGISGVYGANVDGNDNNNFFFNDNWDDGFGGSLDVKYFFRRFFGVGIEGFALSTNRDDNGIFRNNDDNNFVGGVLGTFTFRYPIPCSRFAPYAFVGAGGYFRDNNNNNNNRVFVNRNNNNDGKFMGQFGAGFEVRFTPHVGWTNDISYNDVEGGDDDFIMVRTGLNFAF